MPVYEFYCADCHTVYNFWSTAINTEKIPACPKCGREALERYVSPPAVLSGDRRESDDMDDLPIDESKMESALQSLESEMGNIDEDNPRAMAQLMRKFAAKAGMEYNDQMEAALSRLEAGEDPETIEQEMGDLFEGDEMPFEFKKARGRTSAPPARDKTLYDL